MRIVCKFVAIKSMIFLLVVYRMILKLIVDSKGKNLWATFLLCCCETFAARNNNSFGMRDNFDFIVWVHKVESTDVLCSWFI